MSDEAAVALKLKSAESPDRTSVIVISHDCDLAASPAKEPRVEAILGRLIEKPDGNLTHAKNARALHVPFVRANQQQWVEMIATGKLTVEKTDLAAFAPRTDISLDQAEYPTFQRWLAARYRRSAFPDAFDKRLEESGTERQLVSILKRLGQHIIAIFFDVDDGKEATRTDPADVYALRIYLLYTTESNPEEAMAAAEEARQQIEEAFHRVFLKPSGQWRDIELLECVVIADEAMTYRQSLQFKEWRLEHLSLRDDPPQPMLQA
ncbi:MAG: hypothetical protein WAN76_05360 [Candidatus Sulfotelmatobacter sp.]